MEVIMILVIAYAVFHHHHYRRNRRRGLSILLVEQNTRQALRIAHRAYVLELGCKVMEGTPEMLLADPALRDAYLGRAGRARRAQVG